MKALIAAAVIGLAAIVVADLFGLTLTRAAVQPGITIDIDRMELHCDGDSTRVTVHAHDSNGAAMANQDVALFVTGAVSARGRQFASGEVAGKTDVRGTSPRALRRRRGSTSAGTSSRRSATPSRSRSPPPATSPTTRPTSSPATSSATQTATACRARASATRAA
jgi:hypothetical protein